MLLNNSKIPTPNQIIRTIVLEYSHPTLSKAWKHLSRQMIKFLSLLSTSRLSDIKVLYKHDATTEIIRVYSSLIYIYRPEMWFSLSDETHEL
jgi:hypothetical protein